MKYPSQVILLGIDMLRRFNFRLISYHSPSRNYMMFNDVKVPLTYSDALSREVRVISKETTSEKEKSVY